MSIGKALAGARHKAGLTIDQVSSATRVRQTIVREIEQDEFGLCGGDFYARGHIRAIATAVGLDPAPLLAEFDQQHDPVVTGPKAREVFESEAVRPERRGPNWSAAMAGVLLLVVVYGVAHFIAGYDSRPQTPVAGNDFFGTVSPSPLPSAARSLSPSAGPSPAVSTAPVPLPTGEAVAQLPQDKVVVRLRVEGGSSWLRVTNSSRKQLFEGTLANGEIQDFQDDEQLQFVVGNAAAVRLIVNGRDLGTSGGDGEVKNLTFRPGDTELPG